MAGQEAATGALVRVQWLSEDGTHMRIAFINGNSAWIPGLDPNSEFWVGQTLIYNQSETEATFTPVSPEAWPEQVDVGVVRLIRDDCVLVEVSHQLRLLDPVDFDLQLGNTVEIKSGSLFRVLSEEAIDSFSPSDDAAAAVAEFKAHTTHSLDFDDFGGNESIVRRARELIEAPLKYSNELETIGARPVKGVLFTGPPGTGKTMLARIIASKAGATFYQVNGPEIFSKWYGQSGQLLRSIFSDARAQPSAIIFFDEIDSLASQRSEGAHEESKRVVAQLLTLMDGFSKNDRVVVIATTNRPDDIDVALRRPGRFDWEIQFSLPSLNDREKILQRQARPLAVVDNLPYMFVAEKTENWSGADLNAIWTEAAPRSRRRTC